MGFTLTPATTAILRTAGPLFYSGIQLSSVQTAFQIAKEKSVGELSPIPFLSLLTNSVVGALYGILSKDPTLTYSNGTGVLAGLGCVSVYLSQQEDRQVAPYAVAAALISASCYIASLGKKKMLGSFGCGLCVAMMASPLATFRTVVRTKSSRSLPFWTSFNSFMNGLAWTLFGFLVINDAFIYIPNLVGFLLASVQMSLFAIYGMPKKVKKPREMF